MEEIVVELLKDFNSTIAGKSLTASLPIRVLGSPYQDSSIPTLFIRKIHSEHDFLISTFSTLILKNVNFIKYNFNSSDSEKSVILLSEKITADVSFCGTIVGLILNKETVNIRIVLTLKNPSEYFTHKIVHFVLEENVNESDFKSLPEKDSKGCFILAGEGSFTKGVR